MRVAVIGAGAAGLVTARELLREGLEPVVLERRPAAGGTWIYDAKPPAGPCDLRGPLYTSLRTNLPRDLMAFGDFPFDDRGGSDPRRFPGHAEVLRYLQSFCREFDLGRRIRHGARVTQVVPLDAHTAPVDARETSPHGWRVSWTEAGDAHHARFDAVAVCNGHYGIPRIPELPGLDRFTGHVLHSRSYREPSPFTGQAVALLGAKSSGVDLCRELATVARRVLLCARDLPRADALGPHHNLDQRPPIIAVSSEGLVLSDGTVEPEVDTLVLCTGYRYAFDFLPPDTGLLDEEPDRVFPLYLDLIAARAQTLAFVGLPFQVVPFPLFEHQARLWARVLSGRVRLPDASQRMALARHREARWATAGVAPRHRLRYGGAQFRYGVQLAALAGDQPPPAWRAPLYAAVGRARRLDPWAYRDAALPTAADF